MSGTRNVLWLPLRRANRLRLVNTVRLHGSNLAARGSAGLSPLVKLFGNALTSTLWSFALVMLQKTSTPLKPVWTRNTTLFTASVGALLLATSWSMLVSGKPTFVPTLLAGVAAVLSGAAFALNTRHQAGRLLGFGMKYVQVRSLDEWTLYQYELPYDKSSPEQQNEALKHYRVGLRLFPARPQDIAPKQSSWQWLLALLTVCAFVTLSESIHGWYRLLILLAMYLWLWGCMQISRRFIDVPAASNLTEIQLR